MKINKIIPDKHDYLQIIDSIANKPEALYCLGKLPEERVTTVAIVGTRKPTPYGTEVARKLAYDLAKKGVVIVSGLALGIDSIAHRGALEAGGITIAVQANGLNMITPTTHRDLAIQIIEKGGAIISEYEPEMPAMAHRFLERNRIVSGLSDAVIVVEAAAKSGTLNTAGHALDQNREVFAVPGNITSPLSAGCNKLLQQGAHLVTSAEDVLEVIAPQLLKKQSVLPLGATPLESSIIELLQSGIRDGDELHRKTEAEASEFNQTLTMMEITGTIRALGGNQWTLR